MRKAAKSELEPEPLTPEILDEEEDDDYGLVRVEGPLVEVTLDDVKTVAALPAERNPFLIYIGGLSKSSHQTMLSAGRLAASTLSNGRCEDPATFPWHKINYGLVKRLGSILRERNLAPQTVNKALTLVRNAAKESWLLGLMSSDEYQRICQVKNVKADRLPAGRYVELDEIADLLLTCYESDAVMGIRDAALICLMVGGGLRENEAVHVLGADIDLVKGTIFVRFAKRGHERITVIDPVFDYALRYAVKHFDVGAHDPIAPRLSPEGTPIRPLSPLTPQAVNSIIDRIAVKAGVIERNKNGKEVASLTPHDLRRTYITSQLEKGVDPLIVARHVGHKNPKTTMLYDRRSNETARLLVRGEKANEEYEKIQQKRQVYFNQAIERLTKLS